MLKSSLSPMDGLAATTAPLMIPDKHRPVAVSVFFLGAPRRIAHYDRSGLRDRILCNLALRTVFSNGLEGFSPEAQHKRTEAPGFSASRASAFFFWHPFEVWQTAVLHWFARHLIMEECQVKTESRTYRNGFLLMSIPLIFSREFCEAGRS